jgi:hypothetical protein
MQHDVVHFKGRSGKMVPFTRFPITTTLLKGGAIYILLSEIAPRAFEVISIHHTANIGGEDVKDTSTQAIFSDKGSHICVHFEEDDDLRRAIKEDIAFEYFGDIEPVFASLAAE